MFARRDKTAQNAHIDAVAGETDARTVPRDEKTAREQPRRRPAAEAAGADPGDGPATIPLMVFSLAGQRYAVPLDAAERVLPMVAIAPLPGGPEGVLGAVNVHGEIVPVLDVRRRLGLEPRAYGPETRLLLARTARRRVAVPADDVAGVAELPAQAVAPVDALADGIEQVSGVAAVGDGVLLIHDLEAFFSPDEERRLAAALGEERR